MKILVSARFIEGGQRIKWRGCPTQIIEEWEKRRKRKLNERREKSRRDMYIKQYREEKGFKPGYFLLKMWLEEKNIDTDFISMYMFTRGHTRRGDNKWRTYSVYAMWGGYNYLLPAMVYFVTERPQFHKLLDNKKFSIKNTRNTKIFSSSDRHHYKKRYIQK